MKKIIILICSCVLLGCGSNDPYGDLMEYLIENSDLKVSGQRTPSMNTSSGYVHRGISGHSSWEWLVDDGSSISIKYSVLSTDAEEIGEVTNMKIESTCGLGNCSGYFPVSLIGKYKPFGSAGGKLVVSFSATNPAIKFNLFYDGGKAQSWAEVGFHPFSVGFEEYLDKLDDLNIIDYETAERISLEEKNALTNPPLLDFFYQNYIGTSGETIEIDLNFTNNGGSNLKIFDFTSEDNEVQFNFDEEILIKPGEKYVIPAIIKIPENLDIENYSGISNTLTFKIKTNDKLYKNKNIYVEGTYFSYKNAERFSRLKFAANEYRAGLINGNPKAFENVLNNLSKVITNGPNDDYDLGGIYLKIITKMQLEEYSGALEDIKDLLSWYKSNSNNNEYYFPESGLSNLYYDLAIYSGICYLNTQNKDAEKSFNSAINIFPERWEAWDWLSLWYYLNNNTEEAIRSINKSINFGKDLVSALNFRAQINGEEKNYAAALKDYNEIIKLNPLNREAYNKRHEIKKLMNDLDGAEADLNTFNDLTSFKPTHVITRPTMLRHKPEFPSQFDDSYDHSLDIVLDPFIECQLIESYGGWLRVKTQNLDVGFIANSDATTINYDDYSPYTSKPKCGEEEFLKNLGNLLVFKIDAEIKLVEPDDGFSWRGNHITYKYWDLDFRTLGSKTIVNPVPDCDGGGFSIQNFGRKL